MAIPRPFSAFLLQDFQGATVLTLCLMICALSCIAVAYLVSLINSRKNISLTARFLQSVVVKDTVLESRRKLELLLNRMRHMTPRCEWVGIRLRVI